MANGKTNEVQAFLREFAACWQRLPNKLLFFTLLAAWAALFQFLGNSTFGYINTPSLFRWMFNVYTSSPTVGPVPSPLASPLLWAQRLMEGLSSSDEGHGLLVPLVVLALFYWKRDKLLEIVDGTWWPSLAIFVFAVAAHLLGYLVQQTRISIIALFAGIYGLMGLVWGREWLRRSFFPYVLFVFCVPLGSLAEPISFRLRLLVTKVVTALSQAVLGINVVREGTRIFTPNRTFEYEIAAACSGIRSLIAMFAISTVYAFLAFQSGWKRLVLIGSAIPLAVLGNVFRMLIIVVAAEAFGQEAGAYVHQGGPLGILSLLPYVPAIGGLLVLGHWLREPGPSGGQRETRSET